MAESVFIAGMFVKYGRSWAAICRHLGLAEEADAAEKTFLFFHELAILSGNVLLPLMYHSFKAPGVHLWSIYAKKFGIKALYDLKIDYYRALLNRDEEEALAQVHKIMQNAVRDLSFYGA